MHDPGRRALQDVLTAIRHRVPLPEAGWLLHPNAQRHLRERAELARLYPADWLAETLRIAGRCTFSLDELCYQYPHEIVPAGHTPTSWLRQLAWEGAANRWPAGVPEKYRAQVERELALIAELRYEPFFLTVNDVAAFARERGILHQGRGSAANSIVCYCLGITAVGPDQLEMLFERFVSRERDEPPDIDIDFEHERREEVIQYLYRKYGRDRAALAATVITYQPRSAIRDLARALADRRGYAAAAHPRPARLVRPSHRPPAAGRVRHRRAGRARGAVARPGRTAAGFPAPPLAARRRLRDLGRPVARTGAGGERRHARAHPHPVGQGRPGGHAPAQGRRAGARHAHRDPPLLRPGSRFPGWPQAGAAYGAGGRRGGVRHDLPRRHGGRVPDRVARADVDAAAPGAAHVLRPGHRGGDRASGADTGRHGASLPAAAQRRRTGDLSRARRCVACWVAPAACPSSRSR